MDSKKLAKLIKIIVEAEVAKKHEYFLSKTFPKILEEEISIRLKNVNTRVATSAVKLTEIESDPFEHANKVLQEERTNVLQQKKFTKNEILNNVLNETKPFSSAQRSSGPVGGNGTSVLDRLPKSQIQENTYIPSYMEAEADIDQTINMGSSLGAGGTDALRAQMAHKMGYGDVAGMGGSSNQGLGVTTGLAGLDRILNRDNSELVKKFKR
tara:strand:- start:61 stop:693 length:633 start_codon:yes stop_codon:yes gene_type:complete